MDFQTPKNRGTKIKTKLLGVITRISQNNPWIFLILLISFILNLWGFNWGVRYHPDEIEDRFYPLMWIVDLNYLNPAILFESSHPAYSWAYPTFHVYLLAILGRFYYLFSQLVYLMIGKLKDFFVVNWVYDLFDLVLINWENLIRISRFVTTIMGVLGVYIVFLICVESSGERNRKYFPLLGAFVLATANIWVNNSHFMTVDIPMAFWLIIATYLLFKGKNTSHWPYFLGAACAGGLAFSTKWTGGLFLIPLIIQILFFTFTKKELTKTTKISLLISSPLLFSLSFLFGSPFFLLDLPNAYEGLIFELSRTRHQQLLPFQAIPIILQRLNRGIGEIPTLIGISTLLSWTVIRFGMFVLNWRKEPQTHFNLANLTKLDTAGLLTWTFLVFQLRVPLFRDVIPLLPFFSIFIAFGTITLCYFVLDLAKQLKINLVKQIFFCVPFCLLFLTVILVPFVFSMYNSYSIQNDTRIQAENWIYGNIEEGSVIAVYDTNSRYIPQLNSSYYTLISFSPNSEWLINTTVDYIIITSLYYKRFYGRLNFGFWDNLLNDGYEGFQIVVSFEKAFIEYEKYLPPMEFISPTITIIESTY